MLPLAFTGPLSEWLGAIWVYTLWSVLFTTASAYGAARMVGHEDPGRLARLVAFSHLGTFLVGVPVFLAVVVLLVRDIEG